MTKSIKKALSGKTAISIYSFPATKWEPMAVQLWQLGKSYYNTTATENFWMWSQVIIEIYGLWHEKVWLKVFTSSCTYSLKKLSQSVETIEERQHEEQLLWHVIKCIFPTPLTWGSYHAHHQPWKQYNGLLLYHSQIITYAFREWCMSRIYAIQCLVITLFLTFI